MSDPDRLVATVLGVDPGLASGLALVEIYHTTGTPQNYPLLRNFVVRPLVLMTVQQDAFAQTLRVLLQTAPDRAERTKLIVSCEKYVVTRMTQQTQDVQSLEVTGALTAVLDLLEVSYVMVKYRPADAKMHFDDEMLRSMKIDITRVDGHARDALRHAAEWCLRYVQNVEELPLESA